MPDYELYARERPYFETQDLPPGLLEVVRNGRGSFLEVGSGDGGKLEKLERNGALSSFQTIIATDVSTLRIDRVRSKMLRGTAIVADAAHLPISDSSVDCYLSDQVIEHVPDDGAMVDEMARVLREGGVAYVGSVIKGSRAWYFYRNGGQWRIDPTHVREYRDVREYCALFELRGFSISDCCVEPIRFPVSDLLMRALMRFGFDTHKLDSVPLIRVALYALQRIRIPILGYFCVYVSLVKGNPQSAF